MKVRDLEKLKGEERFAKQYRETMYHDRQWNYYESFWSNYSSTWRTDQRSRSAGDKLHVPILVSDAQRQKASILGDGINIEVNTHDPDNVAKARVLSVKLNQMFQELNIVSELDDAVQDAITLGSGFLIDGFGSEYGVHNTTSLTGYDTTRTNKDYDRIEYNDNVMDNRPWTLRVHPSDILFPAGTVRIPEAHGFWHRYIRHINDVREDEKLIKKHREAVSPNAVMELTEEGDSHSNKQQYEGMSEYVILYDYYDLKRNRRVTYAKDYSYALQDEADEIMIRIDRIPCHGIIFNRNSRNVWGTSDFDFQEDNQWQANQIRTIQMEIFKQQIPKIFYNEEMLEDTEDVEARKKALEAMANGEIGELIGVKGDPNGFLSQMSMSQVYDMMPHLSLCKDEIQEFGLGIGKLQKGMMEGGRHSAYEAKAAESHHDQSLAPRRRVIRDVIIDVVQNWSKLIFEFQLEPEVVKTYDASGRTVYVEFNGADLRGDYQYNISLESMRSMSQSDKIQEANMILSQCMPFTQPGAGPGGQPTPPVVDRQALIRQYLSRVSYGWDIDSLLGGSGGPAPTMPFEQFQQGFRQPPQQNPMGLGQMLMGSMR
jgi:hypothetical protein